MKLYFLVWDGGDGSASVEWFKHESRAEHLLDEAGYNLNDHVGSITLPDGFNLNTLGVGICELEGGDDDDDDEEDD